MQVGIQFFPDVGPAQKSARDYWQDALQLVGLVDRYGYTHVRTIEHYFNAYGGYSPNPMVFLSAAAQITRTARLVTGAVLPAFSEISFDVMRLKVDSSPWILTGALLPRQNPVPYDGA